jgi:hypothetical protein
MTIKNIPSSAKTNKFKPGVIDREPPQKENLPTGPLRQEGGGSHCSLLIFVPRNPISSLINDMTGGYGYSHLAVDCGEIDIPTGKRVMIESTTDLGVHNSFQDEYGDRKFARIPLEMSGVCLSAFCDNVRSKLGEKYDNEDALTFGLIENPAKQICSDLATVCLPEQMRHKIAKARNLGLLHRSSVHVHSKLNADKMRVFVSPNGFAQYFGAPKGEMLPGKDFRVTPYLVEPSIKGFVNKHGWKVVALLVILGTLITARILSRINKYSR